MKVNLFLFSCLFLLVPPFMAVHADDSEQVMAEQSTVEETSAERSAYADSLFKGRCQMCHQLPEPGMLRPKQWKLILTTMQQRMQQASVPPLTEDESERLLEYLAERAR